MKKIIFLIILVATILFVSGCKQEVGSNCNYNKDCYKLNCTCASLNSCHPTCVEKKCACLEKLYGDELKQKCEASGGTIKQFGDGCADSCDLARNKGNMACPTVLTTSCDCGSDKCWNGISCELN